MLKIVALVLEVKILPYSLIFMFSLYYLCILLVNLYYSVLNNYIVIRLSDFKYENPPVIEICDSLNKLLNANLTRFQLPLLLFLYIFDLKKTFLLCIYIACYYWYIYMRNTRSPFFEPYYFVKESNRKRNILFVCTMIFYVSTVIWLIYFLYVLIIK